MAADDTEAKVVEVRGDTRPQRRVDLADHPIVDDVIVYDPLARQTHVLNATAAAIWGRCDGEQTVDALVAELALDYEVPSDAIAADVASTIEGFSELGLLEGSEPPEPPPIPPDPLAAPSEGLPDPTTLDLPHRSPVLSVTGCLVRYHADDPALIRYLTQVLGSLVVDGPAPDGDVVEVRIAGPDEANGLTTHAVWVDDRLVGRPSGERGVASILLWDLNRLAVSLGPPRLSLHAGAAVRTVGTDRRIAVLPAPPDSGKSTLTLGLVRSGLAYLGDEAFGLALDDRRVIPYLKPLTLDPGSWSLFPELEPRLGEEGTRFVHGKWHLDLRTIGGGVAQDIDELALGDVAVVVLPTYEEGAPTRLEQLPASELAVELSSNAFNLAACGQPGVTVLAELAASAQGWRLVSGDLGEAVAAVRDLLG